MGMHWHVIAEGFGPLLAEEVTASDDAVYMASTRNG
jgi:hypothetical protein